MLFHKCKNSVFCACFLFFFLLGTISGTFAFRCLFVTVENASNCMSWVLSFGDSDFASVLCSVIRPLCIVFAFAFHPQGYRAVFALTFARGFLTAYCLAALMFSDSLAWEVFAAEMITLVIFYILSKWVYFRWDLSSSH